MLQQAAVVSERNISSGPVGPISKRYLDAGEYYRNNKKKCVHLHHLTLSAELARGISVYDVRDAFREIVAATPALRSSFREIGNEWHQVVTDSHDLFFDYEDIEVGESSWCEVAGGVVTELNDIPFDLLQPPLFQVFVKDFSGHRVLIIKIHHILCDGYSALHLAKRMLEFIRAKHDGQRISFPRHDTTEFLNFLGAMNGYSKSPEGRKKMDWWRDLLANHSSTGPYGHSRNEEVLETISLFYDRNQLEELKKVSRKQRVHLSSLLYTVFAKSLQNTFNEFDLVLCYQLLNRTPENQDHVADISDLLLTRFSHSVKSQLLDVSRNTHLDILKARKNWLPYWEIVKEIEPSRYFAPMGISPYLFNFLNLDLEFFSKDPLTVTPLSYAMKTPCTLFDFLCNVTIVEQPENTPEFMQINLRYNTGEISDQLAAAVSDQFQSHIRSLLQ